MRVEAVVVTARYFRYRKHFDEADKDKDGFLNLQVAACVGGMRCHRAQPWLIGVSIFDCRNRR